MLAKSHVHRVVEQWGVGDYDPWNIVSLHERVGNLAGGHHLSSVGLGTVEDGKMWSLPFLWLDLKLSCGVTGTDLGVMVQSEGDSLFIH